MAQKTRAQIIADINAIITTNGANAITGALLNALLIDVLDSSANLTTDETKFGLNEYDTGKTYNTDEGILYDSGLYQANQDGITGAFDPLKWELIIQITPTTDFDFVPYDNAAIYNIADRVEYLNKLFICDINATTGIVPDDVSPNWSEVAKGNPTFGGEWNAGYYLNGQVVRYDNQLYYLDTATPPSFSSTDIVAEIGAGNWLLFNNHEELTNTVVKSLYESNADTNALTDALLTKLNGIDANATDDQTKGEIQTLLNISEQSATTTDATPTILTGSKSVISNSSLTYDIIILAVQTATAGAGTIGDTMKRRYTGTITNVAGTTVFEDTFNEIIENESAGVVNYTVSIAADDTGDELDITVTGEVNKTIKWLATSNFSEITW